MSDVELETETMPPVGPFSPQSLLDTFKQEQKEIEDTKEVYIPVKGYEKTGLAVRYHLPESGKTLDDIARKVMREDKDTYYRNLHITQDNMIHLSDGLYVRHPDSPETFVPFDTTESPGVAIGFDSTLASIIGAGEAATARQVMKKLFGTEMAIFNHGEKLQRWLSDTKADVVSELWQLEGNF